MKTENNNDFMKFANTWGTLIGDTWIEYGPLERHQKNSKTMDEMIAMYESAPKESVHYVVIRPDILEEGDRVPVGDIYYGDSAPLPSRWINEGQTNEEFQVFLNNKWLSAYSIDFTDYKPKTTDLRKLTIKYNILRDLGK